MKVLLINGSPHQKGCSASAQNPHPFRFKPAAAVVSARRAGTTSALDQMNKYFFHQQMPIVTSRYWNMVHGKHLRKWNRMRRDCRSCAISAEIWHGCWNWKKWEKRQELRFLNRKSRDWLRILSDKKTINALKNNTDFRYGDQDTIRFSFSGRLGDGGLLSNQGKEINPVIWIPARSIVHKEPWRRRTDLIHVLHGAFAVIGFHTFLQSIPCVWWQKANLRE